jgi:hypothetical protein
MNSELTPDRIVATAGGLGRDEFTRAELADQLGVETKDIKDAVKEARQSGRLEKVRDNDEGKGVFRLTGQ